MTQFMFPIFALFPANPDGSVPGHMWVPLDDYTTRVWSLVWHPGPSRSRRRRWGYG